MVLNDPNWKNLEKLLDSSLAYKDYIRQGFISGYSTLLNSRSSANKKPIDDIDDSEDTQFRICTLNVNYQLCKSYPALLVVPKETTDECIKKNSKCHRQNR